MPPTMQSPANGEEAFAANLQNRGHRSDCRCLLSGFDQAWPLVSCSWTLGPTCAGGRWVRGPAAAQQVAKCPGQSPTKRRRST